MIRYNLYNHCLLAPAPSRLAAAVITLRFHYHVALPLSQCPSVIASGHLVAPAIASPCIALPSLHPTTAAAVSSSAV